MNLFRAVKAFQLSSFILLSCLFFECSSIAVNLFSDEDDVKLGKQMDEEIRKNAKEYPILTNRPHVKEYVERVGSKILASPDVKKKGMYPYQFEIIHDDKTVNAFATPGGYIYVYTGLLKFVDNEATLAGVIGHEIAHAERRHATKRLTKYYGLEIILSIALGENPGRMQQIVANLFTNLAFLKNSRDDEAEADTYSMTYLRSSPYYVGGIKYFFEKVGKEGGGGGGGFERLLSTHPLPKDRIERVEELLKQQGASPPTEENVFEKRYQEFKRKLPQ
jgi:predicted Zn-dependent protease